MKTGILTFLMAVMAVTAVHGRVITGKVVGENDAPLDYANVVLYRDSTYITGTVTDAAGIFSLATDATGALTAKVSFMGYETSAIPVPASGNIGIVRLAPSAEELGELTVRASRPATTMKGTTASKAPTFRNSRSSILVT